MSITAKELAKKLGLSEAAVSMALNNKPGVSTATRKRVFDAAHEHGYNFSRRSAKGTRNAICLTIYRKSGAVVGDTPFFSSLTDGAAAGCKREHYDFVIRYLYEDENMDGQLYKLSADGFSGIILLATEMDSSALARFSHIKVPIVILDSYFEGLDYDCVLINNVQGAYLATNCLISRRKAQPGYLRSAYPIGNFEERADGFYKAVRAGGMSTAKSLVHRLTPSQEGAYADMRALLAAGETPASCYFADNDHIAIGALKALKEAGYRIPQDVGIIGFDDLPATQFLDPPLTTVHVPAHYMGEVAARRLVLRCEEKNCLPVKIEIGTSLIMRKSV